MRISLISIFRLPKITLNDILAILPIITILFLHPSQIGKIYLINGKLISILIFFIYLFILIYKRTKFNSQINIFQFILLFQIIYFILIFFIEFKVSNIYTALTLLIIFLYYSVIKNNQEIIFKSSKLFVQIISYVSIFSSLSFLLFYSGLIDQISLGTTETGREIYLIGFSFTTEVLSRDGIVRPGGFFAEPGQLGVHILFALLLNFLYLKNKKFEIFLIIGMISTLSLGGYIGLIIYLIFLKFKITPKYLVYSFFSLLIISFIGYIIVNNFVDEFMIDYVIDRLSTLGSGGNRTNGYIVFLNNLEFVDLFGISDFNSNRFADYDIEATFFGPFFQYGKLGGFIVILHVLVFLTSSIIYPLKNNRLFSIGISFVILSFMYHRPFVLMYSFYLLLLIVYTALIQKNTLYPDKILKNKF